MRDQDQEAPSEELPEPPSKTKIKQAMLALQYSKNERDQHIANFIRADLQNSLVAILKAEG